MSPIEAVRRYKPPMSVVAEMSHPLFIDDRVSTSGEKLEVSSTANDDELVDGDSVHGLVGARTTNVSKIFR